MSQATPCAVRDIERVEIADEERSDRHTLARVRDGPSVFVVRLDAVGREVQVESQDVAGHGYFRKASCMRALIASITRTRAMCLSLASMTCHGANEVLVRSIMSPPATM